MDRGVQPHVCGCGRSFATIKALIEHERQKHGGQKHGGPACPYCGSPSKYMPSSAALYNGREYGPVWACVACQAWVGCHPGTARPLGRLANKALRVAKTRVHAEFDPIWRRGYLGRRDAYYELAKLLGIPVQECHVGMFDEDRCALAIKACQTLGARLVKESRQREANATAVADH